MMYDGYDGEAIFDMRHGKLDSDVLRLDQKDYQSLCTRMARHIADEKERLIMDALTRNLGDRWPVDLPGRVRVGVVDRTLEEIYFLDGEEILRILPMETNRDGDRLNFVIPHFFTING